MPVMGLSVYMYVWDAQALVGILHNQSAWAGFTLLILTWGQCEGLILGIGAERNFTPTSFFVSVPQVPRIIFHSQNVDEVTTNRGAVGRRDELYIHLNNFILLTF